MENFLTPHQRFSLATAHKIERDAGVCDRVKAVIWLDKGYKFPEIADLLMVDESTARRHVKDYIRFDKIDGGSGGGSAETLSEEQAEKLKKFLAEADVPTAASAAQAAHKMFGAVFSVSGMTRWLNRHGFSYKKAEPVPAKADAEAPALWVKAYEELKAGQPKDEAIIFMDACHPTQATKLGYGWSLKGERKVVKTQPGRFRLNILGSLEPATMKMVATFPDRVDSASIREHFKALRKRQPDKKTLHVILDNGSYNRSEATRLAAEEFGVRLFFVPPYSPNLNLIERAWKLMNELERNNKYYGTVVEFVDSLKGFFRRRWPGLKKKHASRFADNFQVFDPAS